MSVRFPAWLPTEVKELFSRLKMHPTNENRLVRLSTDPRMREVWEWFESGRPDRKRPIPFAEFSDDPVLKMIDEEVPTPTRFLISMAHSSYFPGKPNDMPSKQREVYLEKVRKHAESLINLLQNTRFDRGPFVKNPTPIPPEEAEEKVLEDLKSAISWSQSEMGGIMLAYETEDDGSIIRHSLDFPNDALAETLQELVNWTKQDDYYDVLFSVKPIRQSGIRGRKASYLAKLYKKLKRDSLAMPYAHYASAANVALDLGLEDELDEDSARTQIRRMLERGDMEDADAVWWEDDGSLPF